MCKKIILASSSPYRKQLLQKIITKFTTFSPEINETPYENENPMELVHRLAIAKAKKTLASTKAENCLIIASDQVAIFKNEIIGKPHTIENAIKQLQKFSGNKIEFLTSLSVLDSTNLHQETIVEKYSVYFKTLSNSEIKNYINKENPLDCAGSFKSEGLGILLFKKLEGKDPNTLIGLPLITLNQMLEKFNYHIL
jgi:MAF protein